MALSYWQFALAPYTKYAIIFEYAEDDMLLVLLGLVLVVLKLAGVGPSAAWPWWHVAVPFALAALWWKWSDASGRTARLQSEREHRKKQAAVQRRRDSMHGKL